MLHSPKLTADESDSDLSLTAPTNHLGGISDATRLFKMKKCDGVKTA